MEIDLRQLQMMVESESSIEKTRETLTEAVNFFAQQDGNDWKIKLIFEQFRDKFDIEALDDKGVFLYDIDAFKFLDVPEEYKNYSLGLYNDDQHCRYAGRVVYPVRDVKNQVMGLCGWDAADAPKYLDSKTYGYNAKKNCLYGMEKLPEYYASTKPVFITEGIVCCNYLRINGFQSMALLGSTVSSYVVEILKRLEHRCILFPDNDSAGLAVFRSGKYNLPKARCYVSSVAKDIDDTRKIDDNKYEQEFLQELMEIDNPFIFTKILRMLK